jgi:hypothetical protein
VRETRGSYVCVCVYEGVHYKRSPSHVFTKGGRESERQERERQERERDKREREGGRERERDERERAGRLGALQAVA